MTNASCWISKLQLFLNIVTLPLRVDIKGHHQRERQKINLSFLGSKKPMIENPWWSGETDQRYHIHIPTFQGMVYNSDRFGFIVIWYIALDYNLLIRCGFSKPQYWRNTRGASHLLNGYIHIWYQIPEYTTLYPILYILCPSSLIQNLVVNPVRLQKALKSML